MTAPLLVGVGFLALGAGVLVLRSFGSGYRTGRLLSAAPLVTVGEAIALATSGVRRYIRVEGRVGATDEFEDEHHRPLVFRRVRLAVRSAGAWQTIDEERRAVPFTLDEGLDSVRIDDGSLDEGLVVIPRESVGSGREATEALAQALPANLPAEAEVRIRIDQVSSVDHAIACGVPSLDPTGTPILTAGLGRPLVLTTLARDDAIRLLAGGSRIRPLLAALALGSGLLLVAVGLLWALVGAIVPATALAGVAPPDPVASAPLPAAPSPTTETVASPTPGPTEAPDRGDTRSAGEGPGFVGEPLLAIAAVLAIGAAAAALTLLYVRLTGGRSRP